MATECPQCGERATRMRVRNRSQLRALRDRLTEFCETNGMIYVHER